MTSSEPETASPPVKEIKSDKNDGSLLNKRKPELASLDRVSSVDETDESNKKLNLGFSSIDKNDASNPIDERKRVVGDENGDHEDEGQEGDVGSDDDVEDDDEDDDDDDDDDDDEHVNGARNVADRKGKGIVKDDKGKGKLIEESEDSSSECAGLSDDDDDDDDSDLSDDPLAEVDLDNILPTRTRRHTFQPGVNISKTRVINKEDQDDTSYRKF